MNNPYTFEPERPVIDTKFGKLRGVTYGDMNIFMGVEYAHAKRFHMPEEPEPWEGIKNAYQHGPIAVQLAEVNPFFYYRGLHMLEKESEDCQNLNIWAPRAEKGAKKPVFVWMHGGGFFAGNAFEEISFDGFRMAKSGDIIFVSINHRLNIFGYLNLEDYGEEFHNSANVGIADLVMALKWIHENIENFGGDPDNVTICGHSGGGAKVQCMYQLEECVPYFRRGICLSGAMGRSGGVNASREAGKAATKKLMDALGITKENIDKLYDIPTGEIIKTAREVGMPRGLAPMPNDYFPGLPADVGLMPFSKNKPIIYSSTMGEFSAFKKTAEEKAAMSEEDKKDCLRKFFGEGADELMELFREAYPDHDIIDLGYCDTRFRNGVIESALAHVKAGAEKVYMMYCAYDVPEDGYIPIWHGGEVAYIFQTEQYVLPLNEAVYGPKYATALTTLVINYVKTGDPNCEYLPQWDTVTEDKLNTMIIDREFRLAEGHDTKFLELAKKLVPAFSPFGKNK